MRGMMLVSGLLLAVGCASVGNVGVNTSGLVALASDCGISVRPPDPAKIPTAHPVAVGASSYLIDPAEVPPSMVVLFDETECVGAGPNGTTTKKPRVSVRVRRESWDAWQAGLGVTRRGFVWQARHGMEGKG